MEIHSIALPPITQTTTGIAFPRAPFPVCVIYHRTENRYNGEAGASRKWRDELWQACT